MPVPIYGKQQTGYANMNYGFNPKQPQGYGQQPLMGGFQNASGAWQGNQYNGQYGNAANNWGQLQGVNRGELSNQSQLGGNQMVATMRPPNPYSNADAYGAPKMRTGGPDPMYGRFPTGYGEPQRFTGGLDPVFVRRPGAQQPTPAGGPTATGAYPPALQTTGYSQQSGGASQPGGYAPYPGISPPGYGSGSFVRQGPTQQYQLPQQAMQQAYYSSNMPQQPYMQPGKNYGYSVR